jgi:hypothetical protein
MHYYICQYCNAKWFSGGQVACCPRCGQIESSNDRYPVPWKNWSTNMRITRKAYDKAKKLVEEARAQIKLVKVWEETVAQLGPLGNHQLVAIVIGEDGVVRTECEMAPPAPATSTTTVQGSAAAHNNSERKESSVQLPSGGVSSIGASAVSSQSAQSR